MIATEPSQPRAGCIDDARGRKVTQLDPVALYVLRQGEWIEPETLRAIAHEDGVRISGVERVGLIIGVCAALAVVGIFTFETLTGGLRDAPYAKFSGLLLMCSLPFTTWWIAKRARFGNIKAAMLKHLLCPHCGYDLRNLPPASDDGATICPECGCAWRLG